MCATITATMGPFKYHRVVYLVVMEVMVEVEVAVLEVTVMVVIVMMVVLVMMVVIAVTAVIVVTVVVVVKVMKVVVLIARLPGKNNADSSSALNTVLDRKAEPWRLLWDWHEAVCASTYPRLDEEQRSHHQGPILMYF